MKALHFKNGHIRFYLFLLIAIPLIWVTACQEDGLTPIDNTLDMQPNLSDYRVYQGNPADMRPADGFHLYELATGSFSDYTEKQRLIKIPAGSKLAAKGEGLPEFPNGTIIVRTFYHFNDKRDTTKGKKLIETQLLIKANTTWSVGTYLWNEQQTEATLTTAGMTKTLNWIDRNGIGKVIAYRISSNRECATCHYNSEAIMPIGPKLRNLNIDVSRASNRVNQLTHFQNLGILEATDPAAVPTLPDWQNPAYPLDARARAYLDVNCAHCHNPNGSADGELNLSYETPLDQTHIREEKRRMLNYMEKAQMPTIGISVAHQEGVELIRQYINSL